LQGGPSALYQKNRLKLGARVQMRSITDNTERAGTSREIQPQINTNGHKW